METLGEVDTAIEMDDTENDPIKIEKDKPFPFDKFLEEVGLLTPIDYIFQTFAIQKSRLSVRNMDKEQLTFLFHVMKNEDLKKEIPFPQSAFLEKILPPSDDLPCKYVIWTVEESSLWSSRKPLSFPEFHLYFNDVLHPNLGYSAEELYKVFDARHDETYFINNGPRSGSADGKFHVLFVTDKVMVAIQIPPVLYHEIPDTELFTCKWVSLQEKTTIKSVHESAVFDFPKRNLVFSEEEKVDYKQNMDAELEEGECKECRV